MVEFVRQILGLTSPLGCVVSFAKSFPNKIRAFRAAEP
jgi:hypothetical protein